jgi:DNA invertase Pin-like site-specific DNA recombinase
MPSTTTTRAAVYLRISSDPSGEQLGVDRQREDCLELCATKGWEPTEYVDNDYSASNGKTRPAYDQMLTDITDGTISAVVTWDLDRLHRRPIELESFMAIADQHQLALATVSGDVNLSTAQGRLVARLKGSVAAHETEHKKARQRRAAKQKAEKGLPHWTRAFGYIPGTHQPDPHTAPLVKQAYAAVLAGSSLVDVCALFNDAGAPTVNGRAWTVQLVSKFLRKPANAGLRTHRGQIIGAGTWPALVDESVWQTAQAVLRAPGRSPGRRTVRRHLLTGALKCGACKQHYLSGMRVHGTVTIYACRNCYHLSIRAEHVEPLVYQIVGGRLAMPDAIDLLKTEIHDEAEAEAIRTELNTLRGELEKIGVERGQRLLTGAQAKIATDLINADITKLQRRQQDSERIRVFDGIPLGEPQAAAAIAELSPDRFRAVLDVLMTVTISPVGRSGRVFNPQRVQVDWRQ